jgi:hypothetical protein
MGRPVKRDVQGTLVFGQYAATSVGIKVSARIPGASSAKDGYILKQTGSRSYKILNADGSGKCVLVETITGSGQAIMTGDNSGSTVEIRKLNKRTAIDFNSNRYTWRLVNDSSDDYIELTPIS